MHVSKLPFHRGYNRVTICLTSDCRASPSISQVIDSKGCRLQFKRSRMCAEALWLCQSLLSLFGWTES